MEQPKIDSLIEDYVKRASLDLSEQKDNFIIGILKDAGHEFETKAHLEYFIKTACRIERFDNKAVSLYVDNVHVANWWDNVEFEYETTNGEYKCTMTYGAKPVGA